MTGRIRSPMLRARGLGSAHDGVHHWVIQRVTSVAAIPLTFWLVWSVVHMQGWSLPEFSAWQAVPLNAILMALSVIVMFYHAALGCQVIIEDYVHGTLSKFLSIHGLNMLFFAGAVACLFAILKIALAAPL